VRKRQRCRRTGERCQVHVHARGRAFFRVEDPSLDAVARTTRSYRDGTPVAFIDWDGARPNEPLELGHAARWYVSFADDAYCMEIGFGSSADRARQLSLFSDAYGANPGEAVDAVRRAKVREAERAHHWAGLTAGAAAAFFGHIARERAWLAAHGDELPQALTG
jgi:hypothetical protein